jgi:outer membrane biosynthesis protein TonB
LSIEGGNLKELATASDAGHTVFVARTASLAAPQKARFWPAIAASVVIHAGLVASAVLESTRGETWTQVPIVVGPRTNTVEVGTLPDAVRPPSEERAPEPPEPAPAPAARNENEKPAADTAPKPKPTPAVPVARDADAAPTEAPRAAPRRALSASPRAAPTAPRAEASSSVASAAAPSASGATVSPDAGSFGAVGLPAGTQYFARAFARALPVVLGDEGWLSQPLGPGGEASLDVSIDEGGRIAEVTLDPEVATPPLLKRAIDRVFLLLKSGTFSLDGSRVQVGVERLALSVRLAEGTPNPDESADPRLMNEKGHRAPTRERPGDAHLTFNSGRRVEVVIKMRAN